MLLGHCYSGYVTEFESHTENNLDIVCLVLASNFGP